MYTLLDEIDQFVEKYLDITLPVLIGVSGGIDSLALFEAFLVRKKLNIAVAHVDHGWREESAKEAEALKDYVESKNIKFHLLTLDPTKLTGNLEDVCRDCRYTFFKDLCEEYGYQGVMTGHHAQDQVETVLKRILEGANLKHLGGIRPDRTVKGVTVFRPLLNVDKKQLEHSIQNISFSPIQDSTNADPAFLRARMRTTIVPNLEGQFGKNVSSNLLHFAKNMQDINEYLDLQMEKYLSDDVTGAMGYYLDLQKQQPVHRLELHHLIKTFLTTHKLNLSRQQLDTLIDLLSNASANKTIITSDKTLFIDRGILFIPHEQPKKLNKITLQHGSQRCGNWRVTVTEGACHEDYSWKDCWLGSVAVSLPEGEYAIGFAKPNTTYKGKLSISKWRSNHKVPAFLKEYVPVILQGDSVVHEFLTGASKPRGELLVTLDYTVDRDCYPMLNLK